MHLRSLLFLALLAAQPSIQAQSQSVREFRLLTIGPESIVGISYDAAGKKIAVISPTAAPSPSYPLPVSATLHLYREIPPALPDAKSVKLPFADVTLQGPPPYLVLLRATPSGSLPPCIGQCLSFTRGAQPPNSAQFFNLSTHLISVVYGSEKIPLKPGESHIVTYSAPKARGETIPYKLGMSTTDQSWSLLESLDVFKENGGRQLVFLVDQTDTTTGKQILKSVWITDWFSPPKPSSP